jgi:hypothetical protein
VLDARRDPLVWILLGLAIVRVVGIGWGLPASDGWDNDGVAPRDFLPGLVATFTPGDHYTYPPLHLAVLAVLTLPITIAALVRAPALAPAALVQTFIQVPTMTAMAYVARFVSLAMSLGITWALSRVAREVWGKRAGIYAAIVVGLEVPATYYAHTTNLDVPYVFWASLAMLALVRAVMRAEPRRLRAAMLFAACAVATKDQAYALFLFGVPATLAMWLFARKRPDARVIARETAIGVAMAIALLLVVDGAVTNPTGFRARVGFLLGGASRDFVQYAAGLRGRWSVLVDIAREAPDHYPVFVFPLLALGVALHVPRTWGARRVAGLAPLFAAISFTLAFNFTALRVEHRFVMPQWLMLGVYAGPAIDALVESPLRWPARALGVLAIAWGLWRCAEVDAMLLFDPRYDAEAFMAAHVKPGDTMEVHGLNVYLPRLPTNAIVTRVGPEPPNKRNPLPGVTELRDTYERTTVRRPKWVTISRCWAWRYLRAKEPAPIDGRVMPPTQAREMEEEDATSFFPEFFNQGKGYKLAHESLWPKTMRRVDINASLGCDVFVYELAL